MTRIEKDYPYIRFLIEVTEHCNLMLMNNYWTNNAHAANKKTFLKGTLITCLTKRKIGFNANYELLSLE